MLLGRIYNRDITYLHIRSNPHWEKQLPATNWVVFTIADEADHELLKKAIPHCLDQNVGYCCCAGELAEMSEHYFDEEIVNRAILSENETGQPFDHDKAPITTSHSDFSEGFWFSACVAFPPSGTPGQLVCLDFTQKGVKNHLIRLIGQINQGWLPSDLKGEKDLPVYDI